MKKVLILISIVFSLVLTSCKKGECTCQIFGTEISTTFNADDHKEYKDLKNDCENSGCDWSAKL